MSLNGRLPTACRRTPGLWPTVRLRSPAAATATNERHCHWVLLVHICGVCSASPRGICTCNAEDCGRAGHRRAAQLQSNAAAQLVAPSCHLHHAVCHAGPHGIRAAWLSTWPKETRQRTPPLLLGVRTHVGMLSRQIWVTSFVKRRMSLAAICTAMQQLDSTSDSMCSRLHDAKATMVLPGCQIMACANDWTAMHHSATLDTSMIEESNWSCRAVALMLVAARSKAVPNFEPCRS